MPRLQATALKQALAQIDGVEVVTPMDETLSLPTEGAVQVALRSGGEQDGRRPAVGGAPARQGTGLGPGRRHGGRRPTERHHDARRRRVTRDAQPIFSQGDLRTGEHLRTIDAVNIGQVSTSASPQTRSPVVRLSRDPTIASGSC